MNLKTPPQNLSLFQSYKFEILEEEAQLQRNEELMNMSICEHSGVFINSDESSEEETPNILKQNCYKWYVIGCYN
jgi:hypothetical protein